MRQPLTRLALVAAIFLVALPALAADNGFYLGLSGGRTAVASNDFENADFTGDATAVKGFAGYRFLTFLAVEGSYRDLGTSKDEMASTSYEYKANGYDICVMGMLPLGIADIFAKAGAFAWKTDLTTSVEGMESMISKDGTSALYGVGVQFRIKSFAIRAEVEYFDVSTSKYIYMYSVGVSFTF
jgi:hypothetical protein